MKNQTSEFAVVTEKNAVVKISRSVINQPKVNFGGGSVKWYEDKIKPEYQKKG